MKYLLPLFLLLISTLFSGETNYLSNLKDRSPKTIEQLKNNVPAYEHFDLSYHFEDLKSLNIQFDSLGTIGNTSYYSGRYEGKYRHVDDEYIIRDEFLVIYSKQSVSPFLVPFFSQYNENTMGYIFGKPKIIADKKMLVVDRYYSGTGSYVEQEVFYINGSKLKRIENNSWHKNKKNSLPKDEKLRVSRGIYVDFEKMTGGTRVWKHEDSNCCPKGGYINYKFKIENDSLKIESADYDESNGKK